MQDLVHSESTRKEICVDKENCVEEEMCAKEGICAKYVTCMEKGNWLEGIFRRVK